MSYLAQLYLCAAMNQARRHHGLPALRASAELMHVAQRRSIEIVTTFSHQGAGVDDQAWGEIIGWDSGILGSVAAAYVVRMWLASPTHRAVLLGRWTSIGGGVTAARGRTWFVGMFGHHW